MWYAIHDNEHKTRADLAGRSQFLAIKFRVSMSHPLASFITQVLLLDELPLYDSEAEAGVDLLEEVRKELLNSPRVREVKQLVEIARPFATDMKPFKL